jgi:hypothetical protein
MYKIINFYDFLSNYKSINKEIVINNNYILQMTESYPILCHMCKLQKNDIYKILDLYIHIFKYIVTYDDYLINKYKEKCYFYLHFSGCSWVESLKSDKKKIFEITFLTTSKTMTDMHKLRVKVWNKYSEIKIPKKFFRSSACNDVNILKKLDNEYIISKETKKKSVIFDSMFSIIIAQPEENFIDEKTIDPLLCKCIPIYNGTTNIEKYFNIKGFIIWNSLEELIQIVNNLTENDYISRLKYIEENYNIAKGFSNENRNIDYGQKYPFRTVFFKRLLNDDDYEYVKSIE